MLKGIIIWCDFKRFKFPMDKSEALIKAVNLKPNYYSAIWDLSITRLNQENYKDGWLGFVQDG